MKTSKIVRTIAVAGALLLAGAAAAQGATRNWLTTVAPTDAGYAIGNPAAKVKLTEYVSYTCPHCAAFTREGEGPLELAYIDSGKVQLEIRHMLRDPVDLTAAMLAHCGPPARFLQIHKGFMIGQDKWIGPMLSAGRAQSQRWTQPGAAGRRAIATDFHFYDLMETRGISRAQADKCLADDAMAKKLAAASDKDWKLPGVVGTPTFALNGVILAGTATWSTLQPQIAARL